MSTAKSEKADAEIAGYTYGTNEVARSPVTLAELYHQLQLVVV